jgi:hypothetical protein
LQVQATHSYNPSYLGGRVQKDHGSKPDLSKSSKDPVLKILNTKRADGQTPELPK